MLARKLEAAHASALQAQQSLDAAKVAAELEKQHAAAAARQATADKKAQAEYDRLLKQTRGSARTSTNTRARSNSKAQKSVLEEVLGSQMTKSILTGVVAGIFGTRRRR
jgi:hypothetical protein